MKRLLTVMLALLVAAPALAKARVVIGSKAFAESWILGDALAELARGAGDAEVEHQSNLGGTNIVYAALKAGKIDLYPEYTGTIAKDILKREGHTSLEELRAALKPQGLGISDSLGFNDGYGIAVSPAAAQRYGLRKISDLAAQPDLRLSFSHEFLQRTDGWPGLSHAYGLSTAQVNGIQHDLAYQALKSGQIDGTDVYTTDAQIAALGLKVLEDDRGFFPRYDAVLLYRLDLPQRAPGAWAAMQRLIGKINETRMVRANARVLLDKESSRAAAQTLLETVTSASRSAPPLAHGIDWQMILTRTVEHLSLVFRSLMAAVLIAIPLGVLASRSRALAATILSLAGLLQTIPSLALLAFLIPMLGMGALPALAALFVYSLLPIVRNTYTGLTTIPPHLAEASEALGLSPAARLFRISLPMASPSIMAGIKTSAVINVGTATLAAFIGGGGLGEPILRGIQALNNDLILQGAVPAAVLALLVQGGFGLLDHVFVPRGLRLPPARD